MVPVKPIGTVGIVYASPKARVVWVSKILNVLTKLYWLNRFWRIHTSVNPFLVDFFKAFYFKHDDS